jgi:hypothetical protein
MNSQEPLVNGATSFSRKLRQASLVGLRLFLFCVTSLVAVSAAAWCVFLATDPDHSALAALQRAFGVIQIPFGVTVGLCIFFAAVSWNSRLSTHEAMESRDSLRAQFALHRRTSADKREVS